MWYVTETQFTDIVSNDKFFPAGSSNPTITVDNGVMTITGQCQVDHLKVLATTALRLRRSAGRFWSRATRFGVDTAQALN